MNTQHTHIKQIHSKMVGLYFDDPHTGIPRQQLIARHIRPGTELYARYQPNSPFGNAAAIGLWCRVKPLLRKEREYHMGYVPSELAQNIVTYLRRGCPFFVKVTSVTGGSAKNPIQGVDILITIEV